MNYGLLNDIINIIYNYINKEKMNIVNAEYHSKFELSCVVYKEYIDNFYDMCILLPQTRFRERLFFIYFITI